MKGKKLLVVRMLLTATTVLAWQTREVAGRRIGPAALCADMNIIDADMHDAAVSNAQPFGSSLVSADSRDARTAGCVGRS